MSTILELKKLTAGYGNQVVFSSLDLAIADGEFLGIIGPNGSGKTTLLKIMMGLVKPFDGNIVKAEYIRFGYCMQRHTIDLLFPFDVFEIVMMARTKQIGPLRRPSDRDKKIVTEAIQTVGIEHIAWKKFNSLSGGERQRVIIARALSTEPTFLIMDEPTTYLDMKVKKELIKLIFEIKKQGERTIVLVSHELNELINLAERFVFLNGTGQAQVFAKSELTDIILSEIFQTKITISNDNGKLVII